MLLVCLMYGKSLCVSCVLSLYHCPCWVNMLLQFSRVITLHLTQYETPPPTPLFLHLSVLCPLQFGVLFNVYLRML